MRTRPPRARSRGASAPAPARLALPAFLRRSLDARDDRAVVEERARLRAARAARERVVELELVLVAHERLGAVRAAFDAEASLRQAHGHARAAAALRAEEQQQLLALGET